MPAIARALTATAATLLMTVVLTACGSTDSTPGSMGGTGGMGGMGASTAASAPAAADAGDVMFAQMMIPHHEQAVEMADLALAEDTASAEVRRLAGQVKAAQDPEIEQMRGWLREWGAPTSAPMDHSTGGMMSMSDLSDLEQARGAEFDRTWLTMMVAHHQGAITMAQGVLATTSDPEVEALAEAIVRTQQAEIATMQGLL